MKVYELNWDYYLSEDSERIAYHIPFQDSNKASIIFLDPRYKDKIPKKIMFRANFNFIPKVDYPSTDLDIPIFSNKMISLLQSIGSFDVILTEVIMIDDTYLDNIFDSKGILKGEVIKYSNYKAISLSNFENCFDFNSSIFKPSELNPNIPGYIEKLVLKRNYNYPPVFRIKESPSRLLFTEATKNIFEENNIIGCLFDEIEIS